MPRYLKQLIKLVRAALTSPAAASRAAYALPEALDGRAFGRGFRDSGPHVKQQTRAPEKNPLYEWFINRVEGRGVWKWEHYFEIYHKHFARFVGTPVKVLEIGIFSGGSLEMWRDYFGAHSKIFGVDIEPHCKEYEDAQTTVFIGDQTDREFWRHFVADAGDIDILIDDGGHTPEQQQVTLEAMLPHIRPGGVYVCEDIHTRSKRFESFVMGLVSELNERPLLPGPIFQTKISPLQRSIHSIHLYPYMMVIEKNADARESLEAPRGGSVWAPRGANWE